MVEAFRQIEAGRFALGDRIKLTEAANGLAPALSNRSIPASNSPLKICSP